MESNKIKMHIINYNSTGESSFKIYITTNSSYIIFNNTNYNNITFNLDTPLTIGDERHEFLISLSNLQIPISWPLISSYIGNNYFEYILNGITYNYTIPDGSYSATDLKTLFNSNISLVVSYNKNNGKFTFTHTTYEFTITNNTTCYYEIGFLNNNYTSTSLSLSSINPIDLSGTRKIYIRSNITTKNIDSRNGKNLSNIIDSVPVDVGNFEVLRYNNNEGFRTKINDHIIDSLTIILEDDNGSEIDINNHWSITLEFNKVINDNILNIDKSQINPNVTDIINN